MKEVRFHILLHRYYLCRAHEECAHFEVRGDVAMSQLWGELPNPACDLEAAGATARAFRTKAEAGRRAAVLTIGANTMTEDIPIYRGYMAWCPLMVFVEPQPNLLAQLRKQLDSLGLCEDGADPAAIANVAVCEQDKAQVTMYRETQVRDEGRGESVAGKCSTLLPESSAACSVLVPAEYWDEILVRCVSPTTLLAEVSLQADSIDILRIDTEGYDLIILGEFLKLPGFHPAIVVFEHIMTADKKGVNLKIQELSTRGYNVHSHGVDIWAIAAPGS